MRSDGDAEEIRRSFETDLERRLQEIYADRRWIVATSVDQASTRLAARLHELWGVDVLAVGARTGTGSIDDTVPLVGIGLPPGRDLMDGMRTAERALAAPPPEIQARIDDWDPDRRALVIGEPVLAPAELVGRPVFGARRPEWVALEDKLAIVDLLEAAGVRTAPSIEVDLRDPAAVLAAHRDRATDLGTVWAGDNRSGWHGGGAGTFWIPDEDAARRALDDGRLARHTRVRVMPFVDGTPCSIHGLVVPGAAEPAVFRPCEMLVLRDRPAHRFVYARSSTHWDPSPEDRLVMRGVARGVGVELAARVGYRGIYTVDGILGAGGFVPTEVNLRLGAALPPRIPTAAGGTIDLLLVNLAMIEGLLADLDPAEIERWMVPILDGHREAVLLAMTAIAPDRPRRGHLIAGQDGATELVEGEEPPDDTPSLGRVEWGPGMADGIVRIDEVTGLPIGPSAAPTVARWLRAISAVWPVGLGTLEAAPSLR